MATRVHVNNFQTTLNGAIDNSVTSAVLTSSTGLPTLSGGDYYYLTFVVGSTVEIVKVTARTSNTITIVRGQESTSATSWADGSVVSLRATANSLDRKLDIPSNTVTIATNDLIVIQDVSDSNNVAKGLVSDIVSASSGLSVLLSPSGDQTISSNNLSLSSGSLKASNNIIAGYATTATAGASTTLTVTSARQQFFTGSTTQTCQLPATSTLVLGHCFEIINNSSGIVTITSSGGNTIKAMAAGTRALVTCVSTSGTGASSWDFTYQPNATTALNIADGGTAVTSTPTTASASAFAAWDSNVNLPSNSFIMGYTTTATAAATTTLVVGSTQVQYFTGSTTQTVKLPAVSSLTLGQSFKIVNKSTGVVTVQSSGANTIQAMAASTAAVFTFTSSSGTGTASWSYQYTTSDSDITGSGSLVRATSPTFVTPILGTPTSGNLVNCTGYQVPAGGSNTHVQYNSAGSLAGNAGFTFNGSGAATLTVALNVGGGLSTTGGSITMKEGSNNGTNTITIQAPASIGSNRTINLPEADGTFLVQDSSSNSSANSFLSGYTTTATAAGTTTLTVTSTQQQFFTGSTTQTVKLPVTSTLVLGQTFIIVNNSSGVVTVQSSGANSIQAMAANTRATFTCISTSGTGTSSWDYFYSTDASDITGSGSMVRATSPTLVTPVLGAASATSLTFSSTSGIIGTTTNDNAAAGSVGEFVSNTTTRASPVSLTNNTNANVTSISLTAGDWDIWGNIGFLGAATTTVNLLIGGLNGTSVTLPAQEYRYGITFQGVTAFASTDISNSIPGYRISITSTSTYYLVALAQFSVDFCSAYGSIYARRIR